MLFAGLSEAQTVATENRSSKVRRRAWRGRRRAPAASAGLTPSERRGLHLESLGCAQFGREGSRGTVRGFSAVVFLLSFHFTPVSSSGVDSVAFGIRKLSVYILGCNDPHTRRAPHTPRVLASPGRPSKFKLRAQPQGVRFTGSEAEIQEFASLANLGAEWGRLWSGTAL